MWWWCPKISGNSGSLSEGVGGDVGCGAVAAHMSVLFGCVGVGVRSGLGAGAAQLVVLMSVGGEAVGGVGAVPVTALSLSWWCS